MVSFACMSSRSVKVVPGTTSPRHTFLARASHAAGVAGEPGPASEREAAPALTCSAPLLSRQGPCRAVAKTHETLLPPGTVKRGGLGTRPRLPHPTARTRE